MQLIYLPLSVCLSLTHTRTHAPPCMHTCTHTHSHRKKEHSDCWILTTEYMTVLNEWSVSEYELQKTKRRTTHTHTHVFKYLVFIETRHNICLEARPQEQLLDKQVLHHPLHMAKPRREGFRVVWEGLDEPCLKDAKLKTKLLQYRDCITGQTPCMMA